MNREKGSSAIIILVVLAVVLVAGAAVFLGEDSDKVISETGEKASEAEGEIKKDAVASPSGVTSEEMGTHMTQDSQKMPAGMEELDVLQENTYDYTAELKDVTKGEVVRGIRTGGSGGGVAHAGYENGQYTLLATFDNLPKPLGSDFYEGWIVRKGAAFDVISTGPLENEDGKYVNLYKSLRDLTDHTFYVLTLEPDDGDPAPADHISEGDFVRAEKEIVTEDGSEEPSPKMEEEVVMEKAKLQLTGKRFAGSDDAPLLDFTLSDYEQAVESDKLVVLYFYASWCPLCRAEFPKVEAAFDDLNTDQVIGFRVNFNDGSTDSNEKALAKQHGVAYQHTKVFLKDGERILKSPETWSKSRYLTEINKLIN